MPIITKTAFEEKIRSKYGNGFLVLSDYKGSQVKTKFKHLECGTEFERTPYAFMQGRTCPYCYGISKTPKQYKKEFESNYGGVLKLLTKYKDSRTPVNVECLKCHEIFSRRADLFTRKRINPCPYCSGHIKSPKEFNDEFNKRSNNEYRLLTSYAGANSKVKVKHLLCGKEYMVTPHSFLRGSRCPYCYGNMRKTTADFKKEVEELTHGEYKCLSEYKNNRTDVDILHVECGETYKVHPHDFLHGNRCSYCRQSKGEKLVQEILDDSNIIYEIQKVFPDCGNKHQWLPFDFFLPEYNIIIEYDGIQHYKEVKYFGGLKKLNDQKRRDSVKNTYAINSGYSVIRIPYSLSDEYVKRELINTIKKCKAENPIPKVRVMI